MAGTLSLRESLSLARQLGATVRPVVGTDEVWVSHPKVGKVMRLKSTRKDAARCLRVFLRRLTQYNLTIIKTG